MAGRIGAFVRGQGEMTGFQRWFPALPDLSLTGEALAGSLRGVTFTWSTCVSR